MAFETMMRQALAGQEYFSDPLFGYADLNDPLFERLKQVVSPDHLSPRDVLGCRYKQPAQQGTVVVWILPIVRETILANRKEQLYPSRAWARTRHYGEQVNQQLRHKAEAFFADAGEQSAAPLLLEKWQADYERFTSNWSERHAAFVAGMGSFGLSDAFISDAGVSHRIGSVVTSARLPVTPRHTDDPYHRCLFKHDGSCGLCITRCPVQAISDQGHDKSACHDYSRNEINPRCNASFGVDISGCGLCTTAVPCERKPPRFKGERVKGTVG